MRAAPGAFRPGRILSYAPDKVEVTYGGLKMEGFAEKLMEQILAEPGALQPSGLQPLLPGRTTRHGSISIRLIKYGEGHLADGRPCEIYNPRFLQVVHLDLVDGSWQHGRELTGKVDI